MLALLPFTLSRWNMDELVDKNGYDRVVSLVVRQWIFPTGQEIVARTPISSETTKLNACITSFHPIEMKYGWVGGQKRLRQGCQSCRPSMNLTDRSRNRCPNAHFIENNQTKCFHYFLSPYRDEIWMSWWTKTVRTGLSVLSSVNESSRKVKKSLPERPFHRKQPN